ncbi:hypothetical protein KP509_14G054400 [Ceratopteris richardii]|uniref:Solute carrier family 40 member n=1 Tax=Ceratopteris richardii TaxID=49495 RepID=A0A8T2T802_CERRI|nr:hypothetical protein KP509_14G054400 [Ceratopteris richardii]
MDSLPRVFAFSFLSIMQLAGANRPIALADADSMLCKVHYLCEMSGTFFYGLLLSKYSPITCLQIVAAIVVGCLPITITLTCCTDVLYKGVLERIKFSECVGYPKADCIQLPQVQRSLYGWQQYVSQSALPVSLAAVFLCFNIALAPGSLMTSFLTQKVVGVFNGVGALMGLGATFISASLVRKLGLLQAGTTGLTFQASLLALAAFFYCKDSPIIFTQHLFFLAAIVLARLGHFTYDIIGGQILQTAVHSSEANTVVCRDHRSFIGKPS